METGKLKRFGIYHPKNGELNILCKVDTHEYEYVTSVEVETLVRVYYHTQNDFNKEYAAAGKRSTSVGDIIVCGTAVFMVKPIGFKRLFKTTDLYKKIMEMENSVLKKVEKTLLLTEKILSHDDI